MPYVGPESCGKVYGRETVPGDVVPLTVLQNPYDEQPVDHPYAGEAELADLPDGPMASVLELGDKVTERRESAAPFIGGLALPAVNPDPLVYDPNRRLHAAADSVRASGGYDDTSEQERLDVAGSFLESLALEGLRGVQVKDLWGSRYHGLRLLHARACGLGDLAQKFLYPHKRQEEPTAQEVILHRYLSERFAADFFSYAGRSKPENLERRRAALGAIAAHRTALANPGQIA